MRNGYDLTRLQPSLEELRGIARGIVRTWLAGPIAVPQLLPQTFINYENGKERKWTELVPRKSVYHHFPLGGRQGWIDTNRVWQNDDDQVWADAQTMVVNRFLEIIEAMADGFEHRAWSIPTCSQLFGEDRRCTTKTFLEVVAYHLNDVSLDQIFLWGPDLHNEVEGLLEPAMLGSAEEANEAMAAGGSISDEQLRVLREWRGRGDVPLRHVDVALIRYGSRDKFPRQESFVSGFLYRFAKKQPGNKQAPWKLRQGALERQI